MDSNQFYDENKSTTDQELAAKYSPPTQSSQPVEPAKPILSQPTQTPPTQPATKPTSKSSFSFLVKIIIIAIGFLVFGTGLVLAARVWDPLWSPFRPNPEKVLDQMLVKIQDLKTFHTDIKIDMKLPQQEDENIIISYSGDSDINNPKIPKSLAEVDISATNPLSNINVRSGIIMIGQDGYFNLSEASLGLLAPSLLDLGIDIEKIKNQWIKLPSPNETSSLSLQSNQLSQQYDPIFYEKIKKMIQESKMYVIKQQLPDEKIDGQKVYHYLISLDNDKLIKLFGDIANESIKQSNQNQASNQLPMTSFYVEALKGAASSLLEKIGEINLDFYIGKKDTMLYKVKMAKSIDLSKIDDFFSGVFSFDSEFNNSKFNQPVTIKAPLQFKTFDQAFPPVKNNLLLKPSIKTK